MDKKRFCCAIELLAVVSCYSALAFADRLDWKHIYSGCSECSGPWPTASKLVHGEDSVQEKLRALEAEAAGVKRERGDPGVRAAFAERYQSTCPVEAKEPTAPSNHTTTERVFDFGLSLLQTGSGGQHAQIAQSLVF